MAWQYTELIETLWNVNKNMRHTRQESTPELIETLWNVNTDAPDASEVRMYELIETLWNVNVIYDPSAYCADLGINRNIVECKSIWY